MQANMLEAKTNLSRLIERILAGEEVIIAKAGNPLVRLERIERDVLVLGSAKGAFVLDESWSTPLTDRELEELFGK